MLQHIISRLFRARHYWRDISFDELAELYSSRLITVFAVNLVSLFAAVYLYKLGYSLQFLTVFYAALFILKALVSFVSAKVVAYFGPKHGILFANIIRVPALLSFAAVPQAGSMAFWYIVVFGVLNTIAAGLYELSYLVDFSKVKHSNHAGKEIGTMQIIEQIAKVVSPLAGGVIASFVSPTATLVVASCAFLVAALPLFHTVEPTKTKAKLRFSGFPWRYAIPSLVSEFSTGLDFVVSGSMWALFVVIFVFADLHDGVYAALGGLASVGVLVSILSAWVFGQIVDRHKGHILLTVGLVVNMMIHIFRPFVSSAAGVVATNIANETATSAYLLPFTRVKFDIADSSGFRLTYMMYVAIFFDLGCALAALLFWVFLSITTEYSAFVMLFIAAAAGELLLLFSRRLAK